MGPAGSVHYDLGKRGKTARRGGILEITLDRPPANAISLAVSEDFLEGPRAFAEKRRPVWKGR